MRLERHREFGAWVGKKADLLHSFSIKQESVESSKSYQQKPNMYLISIVLHYGKFFVEIHRGIRSDLMMKKNASRNCPRGDSSCKVQLQGNYILAAGSVWFNRLLAHTATPASLAPSSPSPTSQGNTYQKAPYEIHHSLHIPLLAAARANFFYTLKAATAALPHPDQIKSFWSLMPARSSIQPPSQTRHLPLLMFLQVRDITGLLFYDLNGWDNSEGNVPETGYAGSTF